MSSYIPVSQRVLTTNEQHVNIFTQNPVVESRLRTSNTQKQSNDKHYVSSLEELYLITNLEPSSSRYVSRIAKQLEKDASM